jgi:UDP-N-acetylglucosamine 2-epimerase (non-hydrolysing)
MHFAPTESSSQNLIQEKCSKNNIYVTGNTVIDSLHWVVEKINKDSKRKKSIIEFLSKRINFDLDNNQFILITGHRRENFGKGFINICEALSELAIKFPNIHFIYPVHLNPNVQNPVNSLLSEFNNVHLITPLDYEPFIYLLTKCYLVLTDSGGIQEEAPSIGKPVLVMRDVTERPEAVKAGTVKLVGANKTNIVIEVSQMIESEERYISMSQSHNPYGDGKASERIIDHIKREIYE